MLTPIVVQLVMLCTVVLSLCSCSTKSLPKQESFTFVQLCDPQLGMGGYEHDVETFGRAVDRINELKPDFVAICGDLVQDADAKSFADFKRIRDGLEVPCYTVSGNHDVGRHPTDKTLARYRDVIGEDTYSFEHKGYSFVVVNTQLWKSPVAGETEKQDMWLKKTLAAASEKGSPVFVLCHYPFFLEKFDEADEYMNLPQGKRHELLGLYEQHGVVAVLGGHAHRFIENDYNGMQLVNGETTSKNFDQRPMGFRVWHVEGDRPYRHEFIGVDFPSAVETNKETNE